MRVKRIVATLEMPVPGEAARFWRDILGLEVAMDHGWIVTFAGEAAMTVQVSAAAEGGNGTPVPALSVEVDDLDAALARVRAAGLPLAYGPATEPWGVRRFFVRDPAGHLVNILAHSGEAPS